jgi:hypothetical protein
MSEMLDALRSAASGARHPLLHELIRLGLAMDNPIQLTDAGKARQRMLEQEHWNAINAEFPSQEPEEEDGYFPEP